MLISRRFKGIYIGYKYFTNYLIFRNSGLVLQVALKTDSKSNEVRQNY